MKISIKIDTETLHVIYKVLLNQFRYGYFKAENIHEKVKRSIVMELAEQIDKRYRSMVYNQSKKITITMRFHSALYLLETISDYSIPMNYFESNKLEIFKNQLHQKLI